MGVPEENLQCKKLTPAQKNLPKKWTNLETFTKEDPKNLQKVEKLTKPWTNLQKK